MPISADVEIGENVNIYDSALVNLYGCKVGNYSKIGAFVEIQKNVVIGNYCKISSHSFIAEGVTIEDRVMVGHGVMFINDRYPRATTGEKLKLENDWFLEKILVKYGASIGSSAVILCGVTIGKKAMIGAGAVVTKNVPDYKIVTGIPASITGDMREKGQNCD